MGKNSDPDPTLTTRIIFKSLETNFWIKILKFFDADSGIQDEKNLDPGFRMEKIRIRDPGWKNSDPG
jgi:hypothetical protein